MSTNRREGAQREDIEPCQKAGVLVLISSHMRDCLTSNISTGDLAILDRKGIGFPDLSRPSFIHDCDRLYARRIIDRHTTLEFSRLNSSSTLHGTALWRAILPSVVVSSTNSDSAGSPTCNYSTRAMLLLFPRMEKRLISNYQMRFLEVGPRSTKLYSRSFDARTSDMSLKQPQTP